MLRVTGLLYKSHLIDDQREACLSLLIAFMVNAGGFPNKPLFRLRFSWIALRDGRKLGHLMAHCPALGLWVYILIIGPRQLCLEDNLLPTHGPLKTMWGKKALGTFIACLSLGPGRPQSETPGPGPAPVPPLAGQYRKWHAPNWGPPQLRNHQEVWGGLSAHQGQNSIPTLS